MGIIFQRKLTYPQSPKNIGTQKILTYYIVYKFISTLFTRNYSMLQFKAARFQPILYFKLGRIKIKITLT